MDSKANRQHSPGIIDLLALPSQILDCVIPYHAFTGYKWIFQLLFHLSNSWVSIFFKWWKNFDILLPLVLFFFSSLWSSPRPPEASNSQSVLWGSWILYIPPSPFSIALSTQTLQRQNKANMADLKESVLECSRVLLKWLFCYFHQLSTVQSRACSTCISPFSFSTTSHETSAPPYHSDITTSKSARLSESIKCLCFSTCDLEWRNSRKQCPHRKL